VQEKQHATNLKNLLAAKQLAKTVHQPILDKNDNQQPTKKANEKDLKTTSSSFYMN
jgi:hypothetical protein